MKCALVQRLLVRLAGLEPAARGLGNRCSIHLSYRRMSGKTLDMGFVKPSLLVSKGFYHKKAFWSILALFWKPAR